MTFIVEALELIAALAITGGGLFLLLYLPWKIGGWLAK